jgi:hypothetical protein
MGIQLMGQFKVCRTTEFLFSLDNRFSNPAFLAGSVSNIVTQAGTFGLYYYMYNQQGIAFFKSLYENHSMYKLYNNLDAAID